VRKEQSLAKEARRRENLERKRTSCPVTGGLGVAEVLRGGVERCGSGVGIDGREVFEKLGSGEIFAGIRFGVPVLVTQLFEGLEKEIAGTDDDRGPAGGDGIGSEKSDEAAEEEIDGCTGAEILEGAEELRDDVIFGAGAGGALPGFEQLAFLRDGVPVTEVGMRRRANHAATAAGKVGVFAAIFGCRM
jgi:hypothetical protein